MALDGRRRTKWLIPVILVVIVSAWAWYRGHIHAPVLTPADLVARIRGFGYMAWGAAAVLVVAHAIFPYVPFFVLAGANVAAFGAVPGFLINWLGIAAGASVLFWLSRGLLRRRVREKWADHPLARRLDRVASSGGWALVALCRLVPVLPSSTVDGLAGMSGMMYRSFLVGTLIGTLPMIAVESFFGGALWRPEGVVWWRAALGAAAWLTVIAAGLWVGKSALFAGRTKDSRGGPEP
ncbi:MAG: VTT domain-containing protein [Kyrpidia sp.]|nr:VTT domain-containing protein [Kyrpidia sp.]